MWINVSEETEISAREQTVGIDLRLVLPVDMLSFSSEHSRCTDALQRAEKR